MNDDGFYAFVSFVISCMIMFGFGANCNTSCNRFRNQLVEECKVKTYASSDIQGPKLVETIKKCEDQ